MKIGKRNIGDNYPPLVICELGINHQGSLRIAKKMVDLAYANGAEAIKNQTHMLHEEMILEAKKVKPLNAKTSIYSVIKKNLMNFDDEVKLKKYVENKGMIYLSTPFSIEAAKKLNDLDIKAFKIGSGEFNNIPLIEKIADFKKPMILSTGMNNLDSIKQTLIILKKKKIQFALMHCKSEYPADYNNLNLDFIKVLKNLTTKKYPVGYSDHSIGIVTSLSAISKGASIIEKHFTDSKSRIGPDIICSMDPKELRFLIEASKIIYKSNGSLKKISKKEKATAKFAFSSVVSISDIKKGEKLSFENIWVKRPGLGDFHAKRFKTLLGKKAKRFIKKDQYIKCNDI
jgi:N-acetylneuraminate synthase